jgi:hypothetical protein
MINFGIVATLDWISKFVRSKSLGFQNWKWNAYELQISNSFEALKIQHTFYNLFSVQAIQVARVKHAEKATLQDFGHRKTQILFSNWYLNV